MNSEAQQPVYECYICKKTTDSSESNILKFGKWEISGNLTVHRFCMYFANGLIQRGINPGVETPVDDENLIEGENIDGFLIEDIKRLVAKTKSNRCNICSKSYASIWCKTQKCRRNYHFGCGEDADVQYQFYDEFGAYCRDHYQNITNENHKPLRPGLDLCFICDEFIEEFHILKTISSCHGAQWNHRDCLKRMALSQGYGMKCPTCGEMDKEKRAAYVRKIQNCGVYIPKMEPIWERDHLPDAYAPNELVIVCEANDCLCENGRDFNDKNNLTWTIEGCIYCGGKSMHAGCRQMKSQENDGFICSDCNTENQSIDARREDIQSESLSMNNRTRDSVNERDIPVQEVLAQESIPNERMRKWCVRKIGDCERKAIDLLDVAEADEAKPLTVEEFIADNEIFAQDRINLFFNRSTQFYIDKKHVDLRD